MTNFHYSGHTCMVKCHVMEVYRGVEVQIHLFQSQY